MIKAGIKPGGTLENSVTCLVRGPSSRYPRGFVWLIPIWFLILAAAIVLVSYRLSGQLPVWLGASEIGALAIAGLTLWSVLVTVRRNSFRADATGIWLGCRTQRRRPKLRQVHLPWADIAQLRMVRRSYGLLLEITLRPAVRAVHRPGPGRRTLILLGSLVMPIGFGRGRPALTTPGDNTPRYLVKICDTTPMQLRLALAAIKPQELQLRQLKRKGTLRFAVPPPRKPLDDQARKPPSERPRAVAG